MPEDHYVARTYLKHFGDPKRGGMLHGYQKPEGRNFPCWPKDVCREWDGDINPTLKEPGLLGDFRALFEPHWNPSISKIVSGKLEKRDKWSIAGYMANLIACVPTWHRLNLQAETAMAGSLVREELKAQKMRGAALSEAQEKLLALLASGKRVPLDPDKTKAHAIRDLVDHAWRAFNVDWLILRNDSEQPFITSDNPFAFGWSGRLGEPVRRYLPVTPNCCVCVSFDPAKHDSRRLTTELIEADLEAGPRGAVHEVIARPVEVREINKLIVQCAEKLVLSSEVLDWLPGLIRKYGKYRLEAECFETPMSRGVRVGHRFVVRERDGGSGLKPTP
jgi:hypothetical protein